MDLGAELQRAIIDRALATGGLVWLVVGIAVGLWASEMKKRRFWLWFALSILTGPICWYLLAVRLGVAIPAEVRVACPHCQRDTRGDQKLCLHCRRPIRPEERDRASELGRQAATWLFTARRLAGSARKAADNAAAARRRGEAVDASTEATRDGQASSSPHPSPALPASKRLPEGEGTERR